MRGSCSLWVFLMLTEVRCLKGIASECQGISHLDSLKSSINLVASKFFKYFVFLIPLGISECFYTVTCIAREN